MNELHPLETALCSGTAVEQAHRAIILLHGRGSSAQDILTLRSHLALDGVACVAPQATDHTWYPTSFLQPEADNQPYLGAALNAVQGLTGSIADQGIAPTHQYLLGFSQGACLALEFVARNPQRYAGVFALSGGLIGLGANRRRYAGTFAGTPVVMGCGDVDPHIPSDRFLDTAEVFRGLNAEVDAVLYPGLGHTVNQDEIDRINRVLRAFDPPT